VFSGESYGGAFVFCFESRPLLLEISIDDCWFSYFFPGIISLGEFFLGERISLAALLNGLSFSFSLIWSIYN